ncbi:MAG: metallophosphoesterase [Firmicutes bacterium]|nr:metallophosphoesterase [Bacillota bacterium]
MKLFAISDLHLSLSAPYREGVPAESYKPMCIFGQQWQDFYRRLAENWRETVSPEDWVLLPGDLSWAMKLPQARYDFDYLAALPGRKVIIKGNHDFWWTSLTQVQAALPPGIVALQHQAIAAGGYAICGERGWLLPGHSDFQPQRDQRVLDRELLRLQLSLEQAAQLALPIILMLHYPPLDEAAEDRCFWEIICRYPVRFCLYGHIHGDKSPAFQGEYQGVSFINCSADRLGLRPLAIG